MVLRVRCDNPDNPATQPSGGPPVIQEPLELTDEQVDYYHDVLIKHGSVYRAGNCSLCGVSRCAHWVDAYDTLAAAHQLMGDPELWGGPLLGKPTR